MHQQEAFKSSKFHINAAEACYKHNKVDSKTQRDQNCKTPKMIRNFIWKLSNRFTFLQPDPFTVVIGDFAAVGPIHVADVLESDVSQLQHCCNQLEHRTDLARLETNDFHCLLEARNVLRPQEHVKC